jgi:hypothetical protein
MTILNKWRLLQGEGSSVSAWSRALLPIRTGTRLIHPLCCQKKSTLSAVHVKIKRISPPRSSSSAAATTLHLAGVRRLCRRGLPSALLPSPPLLVLLHQDPQRWTMSSPTLSSSSPATTAPSQPPPASTTGHGQWRPRRRVVRPPVAATPSRPS